VRHGTEFAEEFQRQGFVEGIRVRDCGAADLVRAQWDELGCARPFEPAQRHQQAALRVGHPLRALPCAPAHRPRQCHTAGRDPGPGAVPVSEFRQPPSALRLSW
jgi:hypothetical protein